MCFANGQSFSDSALRICLAIYENFPAPCKYVASRIKLL